MADYLYRDFGAERYRSTEDRVNSPGGFSPHSQILSPLSFLTKDVACRRYQATPENGVTVNWFVRLDIDTVRDHKAWAAIKVPAGEKLNLFKHLPGWNRLLDVGVLVGCGSDNMQADISVVKVSDTSTVVHPVATALDLTTPTDFAASIAGASEGNRGAQLGDYIQREDSYLLKVSITPPFTDADGNGVFVKGANTPCEERSCIQLSVHAHLRNLCFSDKIRGCRLDGYGCSDCYSEAPPADCAEVDAPEEEGQA